MVFSCFAVYELANNTRIVLCFESCRAPQLKTICYSLIAWWRRWQPLEEARRMTTIVCTFKEIMSHVQITNCYCADIISIIFNMFTFDNNFKRSDGYWYYDLDLKYLNANISYCWSCVLIYTLIMSQPLSLLRISPAGYVLSDWDIHFKNWGILVF